MKTNPRVRFLPIVMLPAIMPAVLMLAARHHVPDTLLGAGMGVSIGLAIVGLVWMIRDGRRPPADC